MLLDREPGTPESTLQLLERPNPFEPRTVRRLVRHVPGRALDVYLRELDLDAPVITLLDGQLIPPERRAAVVPRPHQQLVIAQDLAGGGGGKSILRMLAMVAIMVVAFVLFAPGAGLICLGSTWAEVGAMAAVTIGGSMLVNAILPPPGYAGQKDSPTYSWSGASLTSAQGVPIARGYGRFRSAGNVIASYVTTTLDQQWLNILIAYGMGPARSITGILINDNPIENYPGLWVEKRLGTNEQAPVPFFNDIVDTFPQTARIRTNAAPFVFTGHRTDTQAFEIELNFPKGLWAGPDTDGSYANWTVAVKVEYRQIGAVDWQSVLGPRSTTALTWADVDTAPWWLAVSNRATNGTSGTLEVLATADGEFGHYEGQPYQAVQSVPVYDANGDTLGTRDVTVYGHWTVNPNGPGSAQASQPGAQFVSITDWSEVTHQTSWNRTVPCHDVIRVDNLAPGQYEYRVTKLGASEYPVGMFARLRTDTEDWTRRGEETWVSSLREIAYDDLAYPNTVLLGIRALATDKLSGGGLNVTSLVDWGEPPTLGYKCEVMADRPTAYYRLGESVGPTAYDYAGGNHGTYWTGWTLGRPALIKASPNAAAANNGTGAIVIPTLALAAAVSPFALEAWIQPAALGTDQWIFDDGACASGLVLRPSGRLAVIYGGVEHLANAALEAGKTYHVALLARDFGWWLMINGALDSAVPELPEISVARLGYGVQGALDELAIYQDTCPQPGRLRQHYLTAQSAHNVLEDEVGSNPAMVDWDITTNPLYGGAVAPKLMDVPFYREWAARNNELVPDGLGGQMYRHVFGGVFDQLQNLWQAKQKVGLMSRTVLMRTGVNYTGATDKPGERVQLFTVGNIKKDSWKESWLGQQDRANQVDAVYYDANNHYKRTPVTPPVFDLDSIAAGKVLQSSGQIDLFGVTDAREAWRDCQYRLRATKYLMRSAKWETALEGLACRVGDVVGVQHDVPQWGAGGKIVHASDASTVRLDRTVTIEAGASYVLMLVLPVVEVGSGTIDGIVGSTVQLSGISGGEGVAKRLLAGAVDRKITAWGTHFVEVEDAAGLAVGATYRLCDVDRIETKAVTNVPPAETDLITVSEPFAAVPDDYATYFFGRTGDIKDFRVIALARASDQDMSVEAVEYRPEVYADLEPLVVDLSVPLAQIAVLSVTVRLSAASRPDLMLVDVVWAPGKYTSGVLLFLAQPNVPEALALDAGQARTARLALQPGGTYTVRAVGYDVTGRPAPHASAPTSTITLPGITTVGRLMLRSGDAVLLRSGQPIYVRGVSL